MICIRTHRFAYDSNHIRNSRSGCRGQAKAKGKQDTELLSALSISMCGVEPRTNIKLHQALRSPPATRHPRVQGSPPLASLMRSSSPRDPDAWRYFTMCVRVYAPALKEEVYLRGDARRLGSVVFISVGFVFTRCCKIKNSFSFRSQQ
eukprot:gene10132-7091_t